MNDTATPRPVSNGPWSSRLWIERIRYAVVVAVLLVAVEAPLAWIAPVDGPLMDGIDPNGAHDLFVLFAVMGVLVAPFIETAIMGFVLIWLQKLPIGRVGIVLVYALASTLLYRLGTPEAWRYFPVFAALAWVFITRGRSPSRDGFLVASLTHVFFNLFTIALVVAAVAHS